MLFSWIFLMVFWLLLLSWLFWEFEINGIPMLSPLPWCAMLVTLWAKRCTAFALRGSPESVLESEALKDLAAVYRWP